jgi:hypothetical protein
VETVANTVGLLETLAGQSKACSRGVKITPVEYFRSSGYYEGRILEHFQSFCIVTNVQMLDISKIFQIVIL